MLNAHLILRNSLDSNSRANQGSPSYVLHIWKPYNITRQEGKSLRNFFQHINQGECGHNDVPNFVFLLSLGLLGRIIELSEHKAMVADYDLYGRKVLFLVLLAGLSLCLFVCLFVRSSDHLKSKEGITWTSYVCFGLRNNRLNVVDDPDYDAVCIDWWWNTFEAPVWKSTLL